MPTENSGDVDQDSETETARKPNNKVARLIDTYDLGRAFGDRLEELWTADGDERESLRTLADRFNKRLLEAVMTEAGMATLDGEVANLYRLLTDDDVSGGNRTEARRRLERNGVELDQLEGDFVTYQAIRSYLTEYRGVQYDDGESSETRIDGVIDTIQRLRSRTRSVADKSLTQLRKTDQLSVGEFRLFVEINVLCEDCGTQYEIVELLRAGRCDCQTT